MATSPSTASSIDHHHQDLRTGSGDPSCRDASVLTTFYEDDQLAYFID
jgi:hypothetical protein